MRRSVLPILNFFLAGATGSLWFCADLRAGVLITVEAPGVQATQVVDAITMDFNPPALSPGKYTTLASPIGTYSAPVPGLAIMVPDLYGGASVTGLPDPAQTSYMAVGVQAGQVDAVLDLGSPHSYFGLYWPAGDESNVLQFERGGVLIASYQVGNVIAAIEGNPTYYGNPNIGGNLVEPYVYLNFFGTQGTTFDRVLFHNLASFRGFESDNHSVRRAPVPEPSGTVIGEIPEVPEPSAGLLGAIGASLVLLGSRLRQRTVSLAMLALAFLLCPALTNSEGAPILWIDDSVGGLGLVDVATGAVEFIGHTGVPLTDIAFAPTGDLYGISFSHLYRIDATNAHATLIGATGIPEGNALVFGSDGTLYGSGAGTGQLFRIDPATGRASGIDAIGIASAGDLAFVGGNLYMSTTTHRLVRIDLAPHVKVTDIGPFGFLNVFGLATPDNQALYGVSGTQMFQVDLETGAGTLVSDFAGQGLTFAYGSSFTTEAVPEPSTLALGLSGCVLLACASCRRHSSPR